MLALIYKDLYSIWRYNRLLLLGVGLWVLITGVKPDMDFFAAYASVLCTGMGLSALAYDERSKWLQYADALPYGRKTVVRSKYLLSGLLCLAAIVLMVLVQLAAWLLRGENSLLHLATMVWEMMILGTMNAALTLPIAFRIGVERARIVYIVVGICMLSFYLPQPGIVLGTGPALGGIAGTVVLCAAVWAASCALAVRLYQSREL